MEQSKIIVLDTCLSMGTIFEHYGSALQMLQRSNDDESCCFDSLIEAISDEQEALINLGIFAQEIAFLVDRYNPYAVNADDLRNEIIETGKEIFRELRVLRCYSHGRLQYKLLKWVGSFMLIYHSPRAAKARAYVPFFV